MNPNRTEDVVPPGLTAADVGESTSQTLAPPINDEWSLVSYLTQPLLVNSRQDYAVISSADSVPVGTGSTTPDLSYRWTVTNTASGWTLHDLEGEEGVFNWTPKGPGQHEVKVVVSSDGTELVTLSLTQQIQDPPPPWEQVQAALESNTAPASQLFAMREICIELHDYIVAAANSTGPSGVPPLMVAAVMFMEAWGRPKDGSPGADAIRRKLAGESGYWPRRDAAWEKLQRFLGQKSYHLHLHDIREVELDLVREFSTRSIRSTARSWARSPSGWADRDDHHRDGHGRHHLDRVERDEPQGAARPDRDGVEQPRLRDQGGHLQHAALSEAERLGGGEPP